MDPRIRIRTKMSRIRNTATMKYVLALIYVKVRLDNLSRLPEEEGNPQHSPGVSSTSLVTTLQVKSKFYGLRFPFTLKILFAHNNYNLICLNS